MLILVSDFDILFIAICLGTLKNQFIFVTEIAEQRIIVRHMVLI